MTTVMYYFFRENAIREVADKALLTLNSMERSENMWGKELRPAVSKDQQGKFLLEGMSGFYILRKVAYNLQEVQPYYRYKQASANPLRAREQGRSLRRNAADEVPGESRGQGTHGTQDRGARAALLHRATGRGRPA